MTSVRQSVERQSERQPVEGSTSESEASAKRAAAGRDRRRGRERTTEELLASYRKRPNARLRNQLVERHRALVESMARNLAARLPRSVDVDDLVHAGVWGLLQAIENFRSERGAPFVPFMRPRVRGAMLDELRNMDFLPRLYRQRLRAREAAVGRLRDRLERTPNDNELAVELGISEHRLRASYAPLPGQNGVGRAPPAGDGQRELDADLVESLPDEQAGPLEVLNRQELLEKIEASLQPIEWTVLRMHYLEGKSGREVASELRLSASRICQIHVRVLSRLKARLGSLAV